MKVEPRTRRPLKMPLVFQTTRPPAPCTKLGPVPPDTPVPPPVGGPRPVSWPVVSPGTSQLWRIVQVIPEGKVAFVAVKNALMSPASPAEKVPDEENVERPEPTIAVPVPVTR